MQIFHFYWFAFVAYITNRKCWKVKQKERNKSNFLSKLTFFAQKLSICVTCLCSKLHNVWHLTWRANQHTVRSLTNSKVRFSSFFDLLGLTPYFWFINGLFIPDRRWKKGMHKMPKNCHEYKCAIIILQRSNPNINLVKLTMRLTH